MRHRTLLTVLAGAAMLPAFATPALGSESDDGGHAFRAHLQPVPHDSSADSGSNVTGEAHLVSRDGQLMVELTAWGLSPDLPHLMHIHGQVEAENECPGPERAPGGVSDLLIETVDGLPDYGPIQVTFSTSGDTSPASGLALDRAPVADGSGELSYHRTIPVPEELRDDLDDLHIVIHGEDLDEDGGYDPGPITELGAPLEAELPVACGELDGGHGHGDADGDDAHGDDHHHGG